MSKAAELLSMALPWLCALSLIQESRAGHFIEEPQSVNVTAGEIAMFRCSHSDAEFLGWRINGEPARMTNLSGVSTQGSQLTFDALPEYNGSVIECSALYTDGTPSQTSRSALLIVQGGCNGTLAVAFIEEPQSQNVAEESTAKFRCRPTVADHTGFTLNGTSSTNFTENVTVMFLGGRAVLSVGGIPVYHGTIIVCVAAFDDGCDPLRSSEAVLLIQGPLQAVTNLDRGFIGGDFQRYSWDPPPTIDLTDIEPDIAYCITIHNITCGRNNLVISDCNIVDTFYRYQDIHPSLVYRVEVIPRSNVASARNGSSLSVSERFIDFEVLSTRFFNDVNTDNLIVSSELIPNTSVPGIIIAPEQFTVTVTAIDSVDKEPVKMSRVVQGQVRNITFSLPSRRLWEYKFLAYGCEEHLLGSIVISTYEVQNVTSSSLPGKIRVTGQFIDGSSTNKTLVIVYSHSNESEVRYTFGEGRSFQTDVSHLQGGTYGISVFVVEENGAVFPRATTRPKSINYTSEASSVTFNEQDMITFTSKPMATSTGVCITCTFPESSTATDCVAVVHQRISQLNSSAGLMNIESSHKFTRSGDTASGCIEGVDSLNHQFGVVGGRPITQSDDIEENDAEDNLVVYGTVPAAVVLVVIVIMVIVLVVFLWKKKKSKGMNPNSGQGQVQPGRNAHTEEGGDGHMPQNDTADHPEVNGGGHGVVNPTYAQPITMNRSNDTIEELHVDGSSHRRSDRSIPLRRANDVDLGSDNEVTENLVEAIAESVEDRVDETRGSAGDEQVVIDSQSPMSRVSIRHEAPSDLRHFNTLQNSVQLVAMSRHESQDTASHQATDANMEMYKAVDLYKNQLANVKNPSEVESNTTLDSTSPKDGEETAPHSMRRDNPIPCRGLTESNENSVQRRVNPTAEMRRALPVSVLTRGGHEPLEDGKGHETPAPEPENQTPIQQFREEGPKPEYSDVGDSSELSPAEQPS